MGVCVCAISLERMNLDSRHFKFGLHIEHKKYCRIACVKVLQYEGEFRVM